MRWQAVHGLIGVLIGAVSLGALSGCQGEQPSTGLTNLLRVQGAQRMSGRISTIPGEADVQVTAPTSGKSQVYAGQQDVLLTGSVGPSDETGPLAGAVAVGIDQENSYWVLPAPDRDSATPYLMNFRAALSFSPDLEPEAFPADDNGTPTLSVVLRAITNGAMGPSRPYDFHILTESLASADLVLSLSWDAPVDLDLHVVAPLPDESGSIEVWSKNPSGLPADGTPGAPADSTVRRAGGYLDVDSNPACQIDNRDRERVIWTGPAPAGHYIVRVDAFSLCGLKATTWHATALQRARLIQDTWGTITSAQAAMPHGAGSGMTAFEFDVR
jgi:hypothetical protein